MFICKICGSEVRAGQPFCSACGADVVDNYETVCPACSSKNVGGSRYCAKCGGILNVLRKPVCAVCGNKNLPGALFCVACGAPIVAAEETHADQDVLDTRKAKMKIDAMERERMAAADAEIAEKRRKAMLEREASLKEIEDYKAKTDEDLNKQAKLLDDYRVKLNELGSEDVNHLKKVTEALKNLAVYYSDPLSELSEEQIEGETFVCPACGTINAQSAKLCSHCGRSRERSAILLEKGLIKQHPPVKRRTEKIAAPPQDLQSEKTPSFEEFAGGEFEKLKEKPVKEDAGEEKEKPADFSGPGQPTFGGYPYPPFMYPFAQAAPFAPALSGEKPGEPYQMPPIVQPVAFVPYVTQEQPLMQYAPQDAPSNKQ